MSALSFQEATVATLCRLVPNRGMRKKVAHELGTYESRLSEYIQRRRPIPLATAKRIRILAQLRAEELLLADKIERELHQGPWNGVPVR